VEDWVKVKECKHITNLVNPLMWCWSSRTRTPTAEADLSALATPPG
jgi:hypothetical protein